MSRKTQPYRADRARHPGAALTAMLRGTTASGYNPADITRAAALIGAAKHKRKRPASRPPLPPRPPRPERPPR